MAWNTTVLAAHCPPNMPLLPQDGSKHSSNRSRRRQSAHFPQTTQIAPTDGRVAQVGQRGLANALRLPWLAGGPTPGPWVTYSCHKCPYGASSQKPPLSHAKDARSVHVPSAKWGFRASSCRFLTFPLCLLPSASARTKLAQ